MVDFPRPPSPASTDTLPMAIQFGHSHSTEIGRTSDMQYNIKAAGAFVRNLRFVPQDNEWGRATHAALTMSAISPACAGITRNTSLPSLVHRRATFKRAGLSGSAGVVIDQNGEAFDSR